MVVLCVFTVELCVRGVLMRTGAAIFARGASGSGG